MNEAEMKAAAEADMERQFARIVATYKRMLGEIVPIDSATPGDRQAAASLVIAYELALMPEAELSEVASAIRDIDVGCRFEP